jgi:hypothetical protein
MRAQLLDMLLWAQRNPFREMGDGFRDKREHFDPTDLIFWVGALVGLFATLAILARVIARREARQVYNSPRALFRALCAAHQFDRHDRAVLRKLARHYGLDQPARLFVEPERFADAGKNPDLNHMRERIAEIGKRLFVIPADEAPETTKDAAASELRKAIDSVQSAAAAAVSTQATNGESKTSPQPGKQPVMVLVPQMPSSFAMDVASDR